LMRRRTFQDDCSTFHGCSLAGFFWAFCGVCDEAALGRDDLQTRKRRRGVSRGGVPFFEGEEGYFFFFALALVFAPDLATLAVFFFAAIVSTSPNSGMTIASASIL